MSKHPVRIEIARFFVRALKHLRKKYPHIVDDVQTLIRRLESGETPGDQVQGVGYPVYKVRLKSTDQPKGKSGGFRVLYYLQAGDVILLITVYAKSEFTSVSAKEIKRIIEDHGRQDQ